MISFKHQKKKKKSHLEKDSIVELPVNEREREREKEREFFVVVLVCNILETFYVFY